MRPLLLFLLLPPGLILQSGFPFRTMKGLFVPLLGSFPSSRVFGATLEKRFLPSFSPSSTFVFAPVADHISSSEFFIGPQLFPSSRLFSRSYDHFIRFSPTGVFHRGPWQFSRPPLLQVSLPVDFLKSFPPFFLFTRPSPAFPLFQGFVRLVSLRTAPH